MILGSGMQCPLVDLKLEVPLQQQACVEAVPRVPAQKTEDEAMLEKQRCSFEGTDNFTCYKTLQDQQKVVKLWLASLHLYP